MVDEKKDSDIRVSEEELKKIEDEVKSRQAAELKKTSEAQAKDIEAKVTAEMTDKAEKEKLYTKLKELEDKQTQTIADLSKEKEEALAKAKSDREAFEKRIQELEATRKGLAKNDSPFNTAPNPNLKTLTDGTQIDISKLNYEEIEEKSKDAFRKHFGLPPQWGDK